MIELEGSEKQVAWANDIRESMMAQLAEKRSEIASRITRIQSRPANHPYAGVSTEPYQRLISDLDEANELLENEMSAKWWIDHRGSLGYAVMGVLKRDLAMAI